MKIVSSELSKHIQMLFLLYIGASAVYIFIHDIHFLGMLYTDYEARKSSSCECVLFRNRLHIKIPPPPLSYKAKMHAYLK